MIKFDVTASLKNEINNKSDVSETPSKRRAENTHLIETYLNVSSSAQKILNNVLLCSEFT